MNLVSDRRRATTARCIFALAVLAFAGVFAWLVAAHQLPALEALGVPTMQPKFVDARVVAGAGIALERGLDPLVDNPGDPLGRALNYPRVWLLFAHLGVRPEHATWLAGAFVAAFLLGIATLLPLVRTQLAACLLALGLFSPAAWMLLERANTDLVVFALVATGAWAAARAGRTATALLGAAAALKLYPIFALGGLLGDSPGDGERSNRRRALLLAAAFAVYVFATRSDLALIGAHTYHWDRIGFGIDQLPAKLAAVTALPYAVWLGLAIAALALAAAGAVALRARGQFGGDAGPHALAAFRCGAGVLVGSFCLGSNFDYRLVFVLLALPQLAAWTEASRGRCRAALAALLAAIVLLLWSLAWRAWLGCDVRGAEVGPWLWVDEALTWACMGGLATAAVLSAPRALVPARWRDAPRFDAAPAAATLAMPAPAAPRRRAGDATGTRAS